MHDPQAPLGCPIRIAGTPVARARMASWISRCGDRIRTDDLQSMNLAGYRTALLRVAGPGDLQEPPFLDKTTGATSPAAETVASAPRRDGRNMQAAPVRRNDVIRGVH